MRLHLRELLLALVIGVILTGGSWARQIPVSLLLGGGVAVLGLVWLLRLSLRRRRDYYYLIGPLMLLGGIALAVRTLPGFARGVASSVFVAALFYLQLRALVSRRHEPRADVPLHQNAFLAGIWLAGFLGIYGLFDLGLAHQLHWVAVSLAGAALIYLLGLALAFFFLIPPWEFRAESAVMALATGEIIAVTSIWATSAFFTAALSMVLVYLFWGLAYHLRKSLLTRRLMYEYGVISLGLIVFLIIINRWVPAV